MEKSISKQKSMSSLKIGVDTGKFCSSVRVASSCFADAKVLLDTQDRKEAEKFHYKTQTGGCK